MEGALDELLRHPALWRARDAVCDGNAASRAVRIPTGFAALDARLPNAGWPLGALVEVLCRESGIGELSLADAMGDDHAMRAKLGARHDELAVAHAR